MDLAEIEGFEKADFSGSIGKIKLPFIDDSTELSQTYAIDWGGESNTAAGESAPIVNFVKYDFKDQDLTLNVVVDATGVHKPSVSGINYSSPDISEYIKNIKKILYSYKPGGHSAPYLELTWGAIVGSENTGDGMGTQGKYKCVLKEMKIDFELFSGSGKPVRAKITIILKPFINPVDRIKGNSPDLTHLIQIKAGDNLPKLCQEVYADQRYYHDIVRINNLPSAYAIKPGMQLIFPALDKFER